MNKNTLDVSILVDWMGNYDETQDEEYDRIGDEIRKCFDQPVMLKYNVMPWNVDRLCKLYVFDFGGVLPGAEDTVNGILRSVANLANERPSLAVLIYSEITFTNFYSYMSYDITDIPKNIFHVGQEDWKKLVTDWILANSKSEGNES